jgi:hypothetical protein
MPMQPSEDSSATQRPATPVTTDPGSERADLHAGLLARDPAAVERLWLDWFDPLVRLALHKLYDSLPDREDTAHELACQTIQGIIERPERFDPTRGKSLGGYLRMDLEGDRPASTDDDAVGEMTLGGNLASDDPSPEDEALARESLSRVDRIRDRVARIAEERVVFDFQYVEHVRNTEAFAEALGIAHLSDREQARTVQMYKDRIAKRLRRIDEGEV